MRYAHEGRSSGFAYLAVWVFIAVGFLYCRSAEGQAATDGRKVLVLNSYHWDYHWTDGIVKGIQSEFDKSGFTGKLYFEYMDTRRCPWERAFVFSQQLYKAKYGGVRFDVIICSDNDALAFLFAYGDELFGHVPVVFCGVHGFEDGILKDYDKILGNQKRLLKSHDNVTGVLEVHDYERTLSIALKLHPSARQVVVVTETTPETVEYWQELRTAVSKLAKPVELVGLSLAEFTMDELEARIEKLDGESIVLLGGALRDRQNRFYSLEESTLRIRSHCSAPIYVTNSCSLGLGPVGGYLTSALNQGQAAAQLAGRILKGESAAQIPVLRENLNAYMFDYVQLKHFGISRSKLPAGSIIINEPASFYYLYKRGIWATGGLVAGLTALVCVLSVNIFKRRQAEKKLLTYQSKLKYLAWRLSLAEERERRRLAKELHDGVGQKLALTKLSLRSLMESVSDPDIFESLGAISNDIDEVISGTHLVTFELSNPILYELGLERAVEKWLMEQIEQRHGIKCKFHSKGEVLKFDEATRGILFQDIQELLANVVKHADAKTINVNIERIGETARVTVEDDGAGFVPSEIYSSLDCRGKTGGFGLFGIRERLECFGGQMKVESQPGAGTRVMLTLPLKHEGFARG